MVPYSKLTIFIINSTLLFFHQNKEKEYFLKKRKEKKEKEYHLLLIFLSGNKFIIYVIKVWNIRLLAPWITDPSSFPHQILFAIPHRSCSISQFLSLSLFRSLCYSRRTNIWWRTNWDCSRKRHRGTTTSFWDRCCRKSGGPFSPTSTGGGCATTLVEPCSTCSPGSYGVSISTSWSATSIFLKVAFLLLSFSLWLP